ncbi:MAG: electron transfer flavoprotein subunit alpha/FixB family protein, partial [Candidatus Pacebacteria bacterium]|nr:electron transfer flavoprotein subunit alpha/FixB family protein [Candidatus Paceibacterota bacterium]
QYHDVWVIAEQRYGEIKPVTFELLGTARRLASARGGQVWCVMLGHNITRYADDCFHRQADVVLAVDDPELTHFVDDTYANIIVDLINKYRPEIVLCGATSRGRALLPRVAVQVNAGLTADCTGLEIEPETGNLLQTRPAFGGNIMATIKCMNHRPQMATVRPRVMSEPELDKNRTGKLISEPLPESMVSRRLHILQTFKDDEDTTSIADAHFIVAGGRGVQGPRGFDVLKEFAHLVGGAVGASRAAVDAGWIEYAHQVGQTGQTVQPRVYIACGVSGQIQHLVGMQSAQTIIAINRDANAPIMKIPDYAIVGDLFDVLPAMADELKRL